METRPTGCDHDHYESLKQIINNWKPGDPVMLYARKQGQSLTEAPNWVLCMTGIEALELICMVTHACQLTPEQVVIAIMKNKDNMIRNFGHAEAENAVEKLINEILKNKKE